MAGATGLLGGFPLRTHLTLCRAAAARTSGPSLFVAGVMVLLLFTFADGMTLTQQILGSFYLAVQGLVMINLFSVNGEELRVYGVARKGIRAHVLLSGLLGTGSYVVGVLALWAAWETWATGPGPAFAAVIGIVVILAVVTGTRDYRSAMKGHEGAREVGNETRSPAAHWDKLAGEPQGHRKVMQHMASAGTTTLMVVFAIIMIPVQFALRLGFGARPGAVVVLTIVLLSGSILFIRIVQAESALTMWLVFGGTRAAWFRATVRRAWLLPVSYVAIYVAAASLERIAVSGFGWTGDELTRSFLFPTTVGEAVAAASAVGGFGLLVQATTALGLSVTVTIRNREWITVLVVIVIGAAASGFGFGAAINAASSVENGWWTVCAATAAVLVGYVVLRWRAKRSDVSASETAEDFFGLHQG